MDEKTFDLSKLKDTLEIMQNDPYQDIYDDVEADLDSEKFNHLDLFRHCIETCHRIFELSEFRYGKAAKNIPTDFLDEIATLYLEVTCWWSEDEISEEDRYAYFTSCVHYPDEKFSIADLSEMIMERNTELIDIDSKNIELWKIKQNYLQKFFGITYNGKSESQAEKYETLRLLKILHDCIRECNVDLGYLLRLSLLKQNSSIPNSYSKALNFIKERILVRNINSDYRVDFRTIMDLEKYNNSVRSFINSFSEGIVDHILQQLEQPSCRVKRFVCENIYQNVIDNLREIKFSTVNKAEDVKTIQCYAYEHFLMTDIIDEKYSELYSEIFVVEAEENFYSMAEKFLMSNKIESVSLENLCDFAVKYKKDLAKIVHSNITNDTELRKFSVRIDRHKDDYVVIGLIYNLGINRDEFSDLSGFEAVAIVYLYEYLSDKGTDIPLHSGYNSIYEENKKRRDLKIKALTEQIRTRFNNEKIKSPLSEEEYFLACGWLTEQMHILMNHRTVKIQVLREKMKSDLLKYWRETIPLLSESGCTVSLEFLIEKIFPLTQRQEIINKALQI